MSIRGGSNAQKTYAHLNMFIVHVLYSIALDKKLYNFPVFFQLVINTGRLDNIQV